jgi:hypothetical protein
MAALASAGVRVSAMDDVMVIGDRDAPGPFKMTEAERQAVRERGLARVVVAPKPQASASINRNTGEPHKNSREIARRLRQQGRGK